MTRRDAAVLVFVTAGLYSVLLSFQYLAGLLELLAPPVSFPSAMRPAVYFLSYLIPFGLILAGAQLLIRRRHALANRLFGKDATLPAIEGQSQRITIVGSLAFTVLGLLAFFMAVSQLVAVIQLLQPNLWHSVSTTRAVMVTVFQLLLLFAYVLLGWCLAAHRETLVQRWLIKDKRWPQGSDQPRSELETIVFRVVGLWFMLVALVPLGHALVGLSAGGFSGEKVPPWDLRDAATGTLQFLFGLGLFIGRSGLVRGLRRVADLRAR